MVDASGVWPPPVGECAAVDQQQQHQSGDTEHRDTTSPAVEVQAASSGGPLVTATATSPFAFPAAQFHQQQQQENQQEVEQQRGDAPALCVDPTPAEAGAAQQFLAATLPLHTPDEPTGHLGSSAEPCAVGLLLASGPNWRRELGTQPSSLDLSQGAASGLLDTAGTEADTCLPPDALPRVVCRGLRLRGGVDVGQVALEVGNGRLALHGLPYWAEPFVARAGRLGAVIIRYRQAATSGHVEGAPRHTCCLAPATTFSWHLAHRRIVAAQCLLLPHRALPLDCSPLPQRHLVDRPHCLVNAGQRRDGYGVVQGHRRHSGVDHGGGGARV